MTTLEMPDDVEAEESLAAQAEGSDPSRSPAVARATRPTPRLNGAQKVAIVLAQLGPQRAATILRSMSDAEAISLTTELANLPPLDQETVASVLGEFVDRARAAQAVGQGGLETARAILRERLGAQRAEEILAQISGKLAVGPLAVLANADPRQVVTFLADEHPQTIAVVLAHMPPDDAARILAELPAELAAAVVPRVAKMERVSPDAVSQAAGLLETKLRASAASATALTGGVPSLVAILNRSDRSTERRVMELLEQTDPELADEVRAKMFTFDDVGTLDDRTLQQVLRRLETKDLALALKGANDELLARFKANVTERTAAELDEELVSMGPVRASAVDEAQAKIVATIRQLEDEGVIEIVRDAGELIS